MSSTHKVAILNQRAARHVFGDADPIGRTIAWMSAPEQPIEVIGVVDDTLQDSLRADAPRMVYTPLTDTQLQRPIQVALRTTGDPTILAGNVRSIVRSVHSQFIVERVRTMDAQIDALLVRERAVSWLSAAFAFVALILACVGVYGVMSYSVARRVREFGIRLALGAREQRLLRGVLSEAMSLALMGIVLGVGGTLLVTRLISNLLYGVSADDPETVIGVSVTLLATMLIAAYLPARRAARVDPMRAIRAE
jgi:predicted lysophospholipase L1 biosynthesis ABC-type transport system permease subunit